MQDHATEAKCGLDNISSGCTHVDKQELVNKEWPRLRQDIHPRRWKLLAHKLNVYVVRVRAIVLHSYATGINNGMLLLCTTHGNVFMIWMTKAGPRRLDVPNLNSVQNLSILKVGTTNAALGSNANAASIC